ncbi:MAG TPA: hypothetical protein VF039_09030 [Longimicrobiales bacterium]
MRATILLAGMLALVTTACGGRHHLGEYDFRGRTLAVVPMPAPSPELYTGGADISSENPLIAVIEAGSAVAVGIEGRRARVRLDSAANNVDVEERIAGQAQIRASRYLGARAVEDESAADFLLEIDVQRFGIDASGGEATLFVEGEAILIDSGSGREIWSREVSAWDQLTPTISGVQGATAAGGILTAAALTRITVEEYEDVLVQLADYTADVMTEELREDLRDVRDD